MTTRLTAALLWVLASASAAAAAPPPAFDTRVQAARAAAKAGQFSAAEAEYEAALRIVPNNLEVMLEYAATLEQANNWPSALRIYDKALGQERERTRALQATLLHGLGRVERARGNAEAAREHLTASLALRENAEVRVALNQVGGTPAPPGQAQRSTHELTHTAGLVGEGDLGVATVQATALDGPFRDLDALCEAMAAKGALEGSLRCDPNAADFLGKQTPLGHPIYEAVHFAPSRKIGSPFLVGLRLTTGWWGMTARDQYQGSRHDYDLQTIKSIIRTNPTGALVALRIRHRTWKGGGSPDALDSTASDDLLVCGLGENERPACVPERLLGKPNQNQVTLTESGVVQTETPEGKESFMPIFP